MYAKMFRKLINWKSKGNFKKDIVDTCNMWK